MARTFTLKKRPWGQPCIEATDLSPAECNLLRSIVSNQHMESADYKACKPFGPFIQGWDPDGWMLVEFWVTWDAPGLDNCIEYINNRFKEAGL